MIRDDEGGLPLRRFRSPVRISERLAASAWVWRLAKLGYAAKGLLYVIIGTTAALAAIDVGGRVRGLRGSLDLVAGQSFGRVGLALIAAGFAGFILRRCVQIFVPPLISDFSRQIPAADRSVAMTNSFVRKPLNSAQSKQRINVSGKFKDNANKNCLRICRLVTNWVRKLRIAASATDYVSTKSQSMFKVSRRITSTQKSYNFFCY